MINVRYLNGPGPEYLATVERYIEDYRTGKLAGLIVISLREGDDADETLVDVGGSSRGLVRVIGYLELLKNKIVNELAS